MTEPCLLHWLQSRGAEGNLLLSKYAQKIHELIMMIKIIIIRLDLLRVPVHHHHHLHIIHPSIYPTHCVNITYHYVTELKYYLESIRSLLMDDSEMIMMMMMMRWRILIRKDLEWWERYNYVVEEEYIFQGEYSLYY